MRFHHLAMTAFGPYAATETIDFDELNEAGIFLLTGPTGAGKTSILDALCFALYGVVPGVRDVKTLRSHHAADGVAPEVVLELTLGTTRYRVRRSPEWQRPKKRGEGFTRENACASLTVLEDDGTERLVSSRIAEVGHELTMVLGMSSEQFMQVVMLPQGDFQRFLHASSDERQGVLEKLFRTQRFGRIEEWMRDRTRELSDRAALAERQVSQLVATIANRAGSALPEPLQEDRLGDVAATARSWADETLGAARAAAADAARTEVLAQGACQAAQAEEQTAETQAAALAEHATARRVLEELDATAASAAEDEERLRRHGSATLVRPLLHPVGELEHALSEAASLRDTTVAALAGLPRGHELHLTAGELDREQCASLSRALADQLVVLRAAGPREEALARAAAELELRRTRRDELRDELSRLSSRAAELPDTRTELQLRLDVARAAANGLDDARAAVAERLAQHDAAARLPSTRASHDELRGQLVHARESAAAAREHHLDLVERRLAGMAAELSGELADGQPCQVCGSVEHPAPARPRPDAVGESEQDEARLAAESARLLADELAEQLAVCSRELQSLEASAAGRSPEQAEAELHASRARLEDAESAASALDGLETQASALAAEEAGLGVRSNELIEAVTAVEVEIAALSTTYQEAATAVASAVGDGGGSVAATLAAATEALHLVDKAAAALESYATAALRLEDARRRADEEAERQGFTSAAEAGDALLDDLTVDACSRRLEERTERLRAARAVLATTADPLPDVDLPAARAQAQAAAEELRRASSAVGSAEQTANALAALLDQLDAALTAWEPARREHATAEGMSKLVRGMGADNHLQMRLSSYVLATRLDQVLDAANGRLSEMRDQRYTLRRCGKVRGAARAGLGLEVMDSWTGEARAPSTLSGGETFVVSLALALGLADVVTAESGGTRVDTLFIDEGFGMLDPDTLDDVMDRVDALRAGGRTVGVVSHVTELRGRIPTQVHVHRGKQGSTVAVRTLVA